MRWGGGGGVEEMESGGERQMCEARRRREGRGGRRGRISSHLTLDIWPICRGGDGLFWDLPWALPGGLGRAGQAPCVAWFRFHAHGPGSKGGGGGKEWRVAC